jgi:hypothetical protein
MLRLFGNPTRLCDGLSRGDLLHVGGLGAFGLSLGHRLARGEAGAAAPCGSSARGPCAPSCSDRAGDPAFGERSQNL